MRLFLTVFFYYQPFSMLQYKLVSKKKLIPRNPHLSHSIIIPKPTDSTLPHNSIRRMDNKCRAQTHHQHHHHHHPLPYKLLFSRQNKEYSRAREKSRGARCGGHSRLFSAPDKSQVTRGLASSLSLSFPQGGCFEFS